MSRNQVCKAIVLKTYRIGEIHLGVTLFTDELGIVSAIAHGANSPKGKLRGLTNPFSHGTVYLYVDPVKKSTKITDFDVHDFFMGLRESVRRFYTASLWAEIVLKSFGGGDSSRSLFALLIDSLRRVDTAIDRAVPIISVQFMARYLLMMGTLPDTEECGLCGRRFGQEAKLFYSATSDAFVCAHCAGPDLLELPLGALRYLHHTLALPADQAFTVQADAASVVSLQTLLYTLVGTLVESPLSTLEIGRGIL